MGCIRRELPWRLHRPADGYNDQPSPGRQALSQPWASAKWLLFGAVATLRTMTITLRRSVASRGTVTRRGAATAGRRAATAWGCEARTATGRTGDHSRGNYVISGCGEAKSRLQSKLTKVQPPVWLGAFPPSTATSVSATTAGVTRASTGFTSATTVPRASRCCPRCHRRGGGACHKRGGRSRRRGGGRGPAGGA